MTVDLLLGDCLEVLRTLPAGSVQTCVTSPPYYGLRDYGTAIWEGGDAECDHKVGRFEAPGPVSEKQLSNSGSAGHQARDVCPTCGATRIDSQIGLEETPELYVAKLVAVFREVRRVLADDGTLWINMGDSYAQGGNRQTKEEMLDGEVKRKDRQKIRKDSDGIYARPSGWGLRGDRAAKTLSGDLKTKDLIGIPWLLAFALRADGWYLRSEIIWAKPNPMPESVTDRPTKSHEQIFLLSKRAQYYYDADAITEKSVGGTGGPFSQNTHDARRGVISGGSETGRPADNGYRNRRDVWTVTTQPYPEAHFATFPPDLIEPCILAGTSAKGQCPKCGAAWVRVTEVTRTFESGSGKAGNMPVGKNGAGLQGGGETLDIRRGPVTHTTTLGWQPQCECFGHFEERRYKADDGGDVDKGTGYSMRTTMVYVPDGLQPEPVPQTVLDPFNGSGTTGQVAITHGRNYIGIDLSPEYLELTRRRLAGVNVTLFPLTAKAGRKVAA